MTEESREEREDATIPDWLQSMIDTVIENIEKEKPQWPDGKYPALAMAARDQVGEVDGDEEWQAALLQLVIDEVKRLRREKQARVYYQNIVYKIAAILDIIEERDMQHGKGIVCGTLETPETEVQEAMERTRVEIDRLRADVERLHGEVERLHEIELAFNVATRSHT